MANNLHPMANNLHPMANNLQISIITKFVTIASYALEQN